VVDGTTRELMAKLLAVAELDEDELELELDPLELDEELLESSVPLQLYVPLMTLFVPESGWKVAQELVMSPELEMAKAPRTSLISGRTTEVIVPMKSRAPPTVASFENPLILVRSVLFATWNPPLMVVSDGMEMLVKSALSTKESEPPTVVRLGVDKLEIELL